MLNRDNSSIIRILKKHNIYVNEINYMTKDEWNQIVGDYLSGMTPKELSLKYNRGDGYIINKLKKDGIFTYATLHLSKEEFNEIADLYKKGKNDEIFKKYPSLTIDSLHSKMSKLKVKSGARNYWSDEDAEIIKNNYYTHTTDELYYMIDQRHSKDAIESYASDKYGYNRGKLWTDKEDKIIKDNYSKMTAEEIKNNYLPDRSIEAIRRRGKQFNLQSKYRLETYWNNDETDYLLDNWEKMSDYEIGLKLNKTSSSVKDRRNLLGLYRTNKDKQGYVGIKNMLRGQIWNWKKESIKACNYKCVITESKDFHIHHIYSFSDIFNEYITVHPLKSQNVADYTQDEIDEICKTFVDFHDQYPLGVCLNPKYHILFHMEYGKHNNTPEQWEQFYNKYKNQ